MTDEVIHPAGTVLRVVRDTKLTDYKGYARKGTVFEVEEYWPVEEEPDEDSFKVPMYIGWADMGTVEVVAADCEVVRTAEQQRARRAPTAEELIVDLDCLNDYESFRLDQAESPVGNDRIISGVTDEGLRFEFVLTVKNVIETDW